MDTIILVLLGVVLVISPFFAQASNLGSCSYSNLDRYRHTLENRQCSVYLSENKATQGMYLADFLQTRLRICPKISTNNYKKYLDILRVQENEHFQKVPDRPMYVFSAYYEARVDADGPAVRVLAAGWQSEYNPSIGPIFCLFWYKGLKHPVAAGRAQYQVIYRSTLWPEMWVSHFMICKLRESELAMPYAVSVTTDPCGQPENFVQIQNTHKPRPPIGGYGVCISTLHSMFNDWITMLEWIELHKMLGATEITFYKLSISPDTDMLLKNYMNDPDEIKINVIDWKIPDEMSESNSYFVQRLTFNDCMYRTMYKKKYVTIQDIDEVLVPRKYATWPELLEEIENPDNGIYMFQHAYFRRNTSSSMDFISQSSFWRTPDVTPPGKIRCKSMYNGIRAVSVDIHYHYLLTEGSLEYMMPPELGMLHHYRISPMETFRKDPKMKYIEDRHMEMYKARLTEAVEQRVQKLGGWKKFRTVNRRVR